MTPSLAVLAAAVIAASVSASADAQTPKDVASQTLPAPIVRPAVDGVLAAFETHPLVGLDDAHGLADEGEFYSALVRDPRFAAQVGNVVVEFGGAAHQDTLDRYLAGEEVPYVELRRVWADVVGANPVLLGVMYQTFFAQVRAVNRQLPPDQRIHVWLGDPSIDWSKIHKREDLEPYRAERDTHPAQIIEREILARGKKALVIYGGLHFNVPPDLFGGAPFPGLRELVERNHPNAFYIVTPYGGPAQASCAAAFESEMNWSKSTLAAPVRGTTLEAALHRPGCSFAAPLPHYSGSGPAPSPAAVAQLQVRLDEIESGVAGDALLYLGPAKSLMPSPMDPTLYMDDAYFKEESRRFEIMNGRPLNQADWTARGSRVLQPYSFR